MSWLERSWRELFGKEISQQENAPEKCPSEKTQKIEETLSETLADLRAQSVVMQQVRQQVRDAKPAVQTHMSLSGLDTHADIVEHLKGIMSVAGNTAWFPNRPFKYISENYILEGCYTEVSPVSKKDPLPYRPELAQVDPEILFALPDPNEVLGSVLMMNVARVPGPVPERNYLGEIISSPDPKAVIFEKVLGDPDDSTSQHKPAYVTWRQHGFDPLQTKDGRLKFVKEAFGLSDEELTKLLSE